MTRDHARPSPSALSRSGRRPGASVLMAGLALLLLAAPPAAAQEPFPDATEGLDRQEGFFPLYHDPGEGRLLMEVPEDGPEFLYLVSQATGIGSDDLGLDRGEIGSEYLARFERSGDRVFLTLQNPEFRAAADPDPELRRSVEESFPTSRIGSLEVLAEEDGRLLVDATPLFFRDAVGIAGDLADEGEGSFEVDEARSTIHAPRTKAFPENTEVEAALTWSSEDPGPEVRGHTPDGRALTLRLHHSFVQLPEEGYEPREPDPRIGLFTVDFYDYGRSLEQGYEDAYVTRHRLEKANPGAPMSEPVEPIVYYMDPGIPEPYRTAFREGAEWWNEVFEAAGFRNAFRVEIMPPDMDPLDARYNVIQWVHRTEAGSSIGPSFVDPRTGEIIKAAVRMDSHRSLADFDIYMGAVPAAGETDGRGTLGGCRMGSGAGAGLGWAATLDPDVTAEEFAMARRRQHAAHEVGHTLGLSHNFIAASYGRASVMDYPAPLVRVEDGSVDLSDAYRPGPGLYDTLAIRYAYESFPDGREEAGLDSIVAQATDAGAGYVTNPHESSWSSHPEASTWVNGSDVLDELDRLLGVRRFLLDRFGEEALRPGEPLAELDRRLAPVYLHHRFAITAAAKAVGGMAFRYGVPGEDVAATKLVPAERQRRALDLLTRAIRPAELAIPEDVLRKMAPEPFGYGAGPREFEGRTEPAFDHLEAARTLARMAVGGLLEPRRMSRVAAFHGRDASLPAPTDVVRRLVAETWERRPDGGAERPVLARAVERVLADELMRLGSDGEAAPEARAAAEWGLRRILSLAGEGRERTGAEPADLDAEELAHRQNVAADVRRFLARDFGERTLPGALDPPRGTPIGEGGPGGGGR